MRRPHHTVATVLVRPSALPDLELRLMTADLWVWPVRTAPVVADGRRTEDQLRRHLVEQRRGAWDDAAAWTPVWIGFGDSWRAPDPADPLPWAAHRQLWDTLSEHAEHVRYRKRLGGIPTAPASLERHTFRSP